MREEDTFEGLFAGFDEVAEEGESPLLDTSSNTLTHSRAPGLNTRFVRWILQGSGLTVLYLIGFFIMIASIQEVVICTLGVLAIALLAAPLLGSRPSANPLRWALLLPLVSVLAAMATAIARWPFFMVQAPHTPLSDLVLASCQVAEWATSPGTLAACATLGIVLIGLARWLARANPWVETRAKWHAWRRVLGLGSIGLVAGVMLSLPLLYHFTWNQAWIARTDVLIAEGKPQAFSATGDLSTIFLGHAAQTDFDAGSVIDALRKQSLIEKLVLCNAYLEANNPLTVSDVSLLVRLTERCELEAPNPEIDRFLWLAYRRAFAKELGFRGGTATTRVLRQTLLSRFCAAPTRPDELEFWRQRTDFMSVRHPVTRGATDDIFLHRLQDYRPGFPTPFLCQARFHRPLRLFGFATPWTPAGLSLKAERTLALLVYSHRRKSITTDVFPDEYLLAPPYTHSNWLDAPLYEVFAAVNDALPYHYAADDEALVGTVLNLKQQKLKTGRYPATYDAPSELRYQSDGATARLSTVGVPRTSHLYFDGRLR